MLNGKKILLTGSNGGIGNEIAKLLIKNDAEVILCYHENHENIDLLLKENKKQKNNIHKFQNRGRLLDKSTATRQSKTMAIDGQPGPSKNCNHRLFLCVTDSSNAFIIPNGSWLGHTGKCQKSLPRSR